MHLWKIKKKIRTEDSVTWTNSMTDKMYQNSRCSWNRFFSVWIRVNKKYSSIQFFSSWLKKYRINGKNLTTCKNNLNWWSLKIFLIIKPVIFTNLCKTNLIVSEGTLTMLLKYLSHWDFSNSLFYTGITGKPARIYKSMQNKNDRSTKCLYI
jgi:hypothetical protein